MKQLLCMREVGRHGDGGGLYPPREGNRVPVLVFRTPTQFFTRLANAKFTFEIAEMTATDANTAAVALHIHNVSRGSIRNGTLNAIEIFSFKPDGKLAGMKAYWSVEDLAASQ